MAAIQRHGRRLVRRLGTYAFALGGPRRRYEAARDAHLACRPRNANACAHEAHHATCPQSALPPARRFDAVLLRPAPRRAREQVLRIAESACARCSPHCNPSSCPGIRARWRGGIPPPNYAPRPSRCRPTSSLPSCSCAILRAAFNSARRGIRAQGLESRRGLPRPAAHAIIGRSSFRRSPARAFCTGRMIRTGPPNVSIPAASSGERRRRGFRPRGTRRPFASCQVHLRPVSSRTLARILASPCARGPSGRGAASGPRSSTGSPHQRVAPRALAEHQRARCVAVAEADHALDCGSSSPEVAIAASMLAARASRVSPAARIAYSAAVEADTGCPPRRSARRARLARNAPLRSSCRRPNNTRSRPCGVERSGELVPAARECEVCGSFLGQSDGHDRASASACCGSSSARRATQRGSAEHGLGRIAMRSVAGSAVSSAATISSRDCQPASSIPRAGRSPRPRAPMRPPSFARCARAAWRSHCRPPMGRSANPKPGGASRHRHEG